MKKQFKRLKINGLVYNTHIQIKKTTLGYRVFIELNSRTKKRAEAIMTDLMEDVN